MGSPLGPTLQFFWGVAHLENQSMAQQDVFMPMHYSTYEDDIFCVVSSLEYVEMFLSFLIHMLPTLKLNLINCETGPQKLAFLDTQISQYSNDDVSLITSVCSQLTPKLSLIFMLFALVIGKVA